MAGQTPDQLLERLAKGRPIAALFLLGGDAYLRDLCRAKLIEAYIPEGMHDWAVSRFSLREAPLDRVLQQAETRPMMAPQQVIFVDGLEVLVRKLGGGEDEEQEDSAAKEKRDAMLAPLAGYYPAMKLGPAWWFHDSIQGMIRYRQRVTETAGFYNTVGFNDDTRAFVSIPARHDLARRVDSNFLAGLVARHILTIEGARSIARDLTYTLVKKAYKLG